MTELIAVYEALRSALDEAEKERNPINATERAASLGLEHSRQPAALGFEDVYRLTDGAGFTVLMTHEEWDMTRTQEPPPPGVSRLHVSLVRPDGETEKSHSVTFTP